MTAPRKIVPGQTYFITRRCSRREYLLRPDDLTNQIFAYCLAEAAARHRIGVVAGLAMSNHYHAVVHDPKGRLPAFLEHFHKMLAKALNVRWQRWENFWSTEETCVTRLVTSKDIFDKVVYVLCNPIAGDLVDRVQDWPGFSSLAFLGGAKKTYARPKLFFREDGVMPKRVELRFVVPPSITKSEASDAWRARVRKAVAERERAIRGARAAGKRRVMGRKAVLRAHYAEAPKTTPARARLRPAIACKDPERRKLELNALKEFRAAYAIARESWSSGDRRVVFPLGTYALLASGVRCGPSPKRR